MKQVGTAWDGTAVEVTFNPTSLFEDGQSVDIGDRETMRELRELAYERSRERMAMQWNMPIEALTPNAIDWRTFP